MISFLSKKDGKRGQKNGPKPVDFTECCFPLACNIHVLCSLFFFIIYVSNFSRKGYNGC